MFYGSLAAGKCQIEDMLLVYSLCLAVTSFSSKMDDKIEVIASEGFCDTS